MIPCIEVLKEILVNDTNNEDIFRVVGRQNEILTDKSGLLRDIEFLKNCGILL